MHSRTRTSGRDSRILVCVLQVLKPRYDRLYHISLPAEMHSVSCHIQHGGKIWTASMLHVTRMNNFGVERMIFIRCDHVFISRVLGHLRTCLYCDSASELSLEAQSSIVMPIALGSV